MRDRIVTLINSSICHTTHNTCCHCQCCVAVVNILLGPQKFQHKLSYITCILLAPARLYTSNMLTGDLEDKAARKYAAYNKKKKSVLSILITGVLSFLLPRL